MTGKVKPLRQGMASLTLVLIVTALIALIMVPIFLVTYIRNTQAVRFHHSQQAFFAAEGAYAETVGRLKLHDVWGKSGVNDIYFVGPNEISRSVVWVDPPGKFQIAITANNRLAQRKIEGEFTPSTSSTPTPNKYDVVLVLDTSASMNTNCNPTCPIHLLKPAAENLLNKLRGANNRVGLVMFGWPDYVHDDVLNPKFNYATDSYVDELTTAVVNRTAGGGTTMSWGLYHAVSILNNNFIDDPERKRFIIFFSDGVPNFTITNGEYPQPWCALPASRNEQPCTCNSDECTEPETSFAFGNYFETLFGNRVKYPPAQFETLFGLPYLQHYGSHCTSVSIKIANDAKNNPDPKKNITFYTVFLPNDSKAFCYSYDPLNQPILDDTNDPGGVFRGRVRKLGQLTSYAISSETDPHNFVEGTDYEFYKEAASAHDLDDIFTNIIDTITSGGSSSYYETVPD
jgi:hypothetical protein